MALDIPDTPFPFPENSGNDGIPYDGGIPEYDGVPYAGGIPLPNICLNKNHYDVPSIIFSFVHITLYLKFLNFTMDVSFAMTHLLCLIPAHSATLNRKNSMKTKYCRQNLSKCQS